MAEQDQDAGGEKEFEASEEKRRRAREEGNIPQSKETNTLALVFGIINTMLMAVLERIKELGMLMAIGMNKLRVFLMIVLESILLGLVAMPVGLLLGYITIEYVGANGIDMSMYAKGLANFGMSPIIYFELDPIVYLQVAVGVFLTAVLASIYPALKAIRLKPVEALRTI